jgi:hypothetical protein
MPHGKQKLGGSSFVGGKKSKVPERSSEADRDKKTKSCISKVLMPMWHPYHFSD